MFSVEVEVKGVGCRDKQFNAGGDHQGEYGISELVRRKTGPVQHLDNIVVFLCLWARALCQRVDNFACECLELVDCQHPSDSVR